MKRRVIIGILMVSIIAWLIFIVVTMPLLVGFDEQGHAIVERLQSEFDVPIDGMTNKKGIYTHGQTHIKHGHWVLGSTIEIYGVTNISQQDKIIKRVQEISDKQKYVVVTFYDKSNFKISGTPSDELTVRLPSNVIRRTTVNP